jgi:hypothetical protein
VFFTFFFSLTSFIEFSGLLRVISLLFRSTLIKKRNAKIFDHYRRIKTGVSEPPCLVRCSPRLVMFELCRHWAATSPPTKTDIEKMKREGLSAPTLGGFFVFFRFRQVFHAINFGVVPIT